MFFVFAFPFWQTMNSQCGSFAIVETEVLVGFERTCTGLETEKSKSIRFEAIIIKLPQKINQNSLDFID